MVAFELLLALLTLPCMCLLHMLTALTAGNAALTDSGVAESAIEMLPIYFLAPLSQIRLEFFSETVRGKLTVGERMEPMTPSIYIQTFFSS